MANWRRHTRCLQTNSTVSTISKIGGGLMRFSKNQSGKFLQRKNRSMLERTCRCVVNQGCNQVRTLCSAQVNKSNGADMESKDNRIRLLKRSNQKPNNVSPREDDSHHSLLVDISRQTGRDNAMQSHAVLQSWTDMSTPRSNPPQLRIFSDTLNSG